jgi:magnesium and cobalt transporter
VVASVIASGHSRLPATDGDRDNICGVLHAKDLLRLGSGNQSDLRALLRPAMFIPESKRVDVLLREFRLNRYHLAVVVDEYGGVSGMVTIEDVLEQIVGEIEDEFDEVDPIDDIVPIGPGLQGSRWRIHAMTEISRVNGALGTNLDEDEFDTLGGLVVHELGRVPVRGETLRLSRLACEVLRANARQVQLLMVEVLPEEPPEAASAQETFGRPAGSTQAASNGR